MARELSAHETHVVATNLPTDRLVMNLMSFIPGKDIFGGSLLRVLDDRFSIAVQLGGHSR